LELNSIIPLINTTRKGAANFTTIFYNVVATDRPASRFDGARRRDLDHRPFPLITIIESISKLSRIK